MDSALSQLHKFKQAARELGTDDDPERFKVRVRKVGSAKAPEKHPTRKV
ncbi:hypothetical protein [Enterovirga aerilata]|uniref:Uncharacterized protein n=1 Tax=Enterovirga aerilata TaxID=2730920 RepID=A0A849HVP5_9HYPH|nr:hypothetical protein [Enterovirga sp. DB1703]NNM71182.1 hypothetical protein [Enterovirga sp. DB1703]